MVFTTLLRQTSLQTSGRKGFGRNDEFLLLTTVSNVGNTRLFNPAFINLEHAITFCRILVHVVFVMYLLPRMMTTESICLHLTSCRNAPSKLQPPDGWSVFTQFLTSFILKIEIEKYHLQHERPCCISIYKLEPKVRVVYLIQHGRECCK